MEIVTSTRDVAKSMYDISIILDSYKISKMMEIKNNSKFLQEEKNKTLKGTLHIVLQSKKVNKHFQSWKPKPRTVEIKMQSRKLLKLKYVPYIFSLPSP